VWPNCEFTFTVFLVLLLARHSAIVLPTTDPPTTSDKLVLVLLASKGPARALLGMRSGQSGTFRIHFVGNEFVSHRITFDHGTGRSVET
jgi:hypothetical protein